MIRLVRELDHITTVHTYLFIFKVIQFWLPVIYHVYFVKSLIEIIAFGRGSYVTEEYVR